MSSSEAEVAIKKLARVAGNTMCPNCGSIQKFGFSTVCMKVLSFVCNDCKSSHQSFSHRCKSVTMSTWTHDEVKTIRDSGGNDRCRNTWLARAPSVGVGNRPRPGDSIEKFKMFIREAYEQRKYYMDAEGNQTSIVTLPTSKLAPEHPQQPQQQLRQPAPSPSDQLSQYAQHKHVEVDFFSFADDSKHSTSSSFMNQPMTEAKTLDKNPPFDLFSVSSTTNANISSGNHAVTAVTPSWDPFGAPTLSRDVPTSSISTTIPTQQSVAAATPAMTTKTPAMMFDPFGSSHSPAYMHTGSTNTGPKTYSGESSLSTTIATTVAASNSQSNLPFNAMAMNNYSNNTSMNPSFVGMNMSANMMMTNNFVNANNSNNNFSNAMMNSNMYNTSLGIMDSKNYSSMGNAMNHTNGNSTSVNNYMNSGMMMNSTSSNSHNYSSTGYTGFGVGTSSGSGSSLANSINNHSNVNNYYLPNNKSTSTTGLGGEYNYSKKSANLTMSNDPFAGLAKFG